MALETASPPQGANPCIATSAGLGSIDVSQRKVVIDAGAAIKLQRLERLGGELFTTSGVLAEVRDEHARALLGTLPLELQVKEPLPADIAYVKQFAKATGDLGFLSENDISLIALTVHLHKQNGGAALRDKPSALSHTQECETATFDWAPKRASRNCAEDAKGYDPAEPADVSTTPTVEDPASACAQNFPNNEEGDSVESDDEDGSSAGEWVTQENMHRFGVGVELGSQIRVTCASSDYSVQNVLMQMGITPLTFDGYAVKTVKLWGLVCRACFFFTRETQKVFCPKCGHDTLVRVPIVVDQDGEPRALNNGRKLRTKGTIYSQPKPQNGRGWKPVFAEDELLMGGRDREMRRLQNLHNKEKMSRDPFNEDNGARGWWQRGTTATGKMLVGDAPRVQAGYGRRNPNANNFRGFKGSKKR